MSLYKFTYWGLLLIFPFITISASVQVTDTIANWDGINVEWSIYGATGQLVDNPEQLGINPSANCFEISTSSDPYDFMYTDFSAPVNFPEFPLYRIIITP